MAPEFRALSSYNSQKKATLWPKHAHPMLLWRRILLFIATSIMPSLLRLSIALETHLLSLYRKCP